MTRLIIQVQSTSKMKLSYRDRSNRVRSMIKTKQDNDVIDHIDVVYTKNETEYS